MGELSYTLLPILIFLTHKFKPFFFKHHQPPNMFAFTILFTLSAVSCVNASSRRTKEEQILDINQLYKVYPLVCKSADKVCNGYVDDIDARILLLRIHTMLFNRDIKGFRSDEVIRYINHALDQHPRRPEFCYQYLMDYLLDILARRNKDVLEPTS